MSDAIDTQAGPRPVTYIGRRIVKGAKGPEKLQHVFLEDGVRVWWPKVKASVFAGARIGRTYALTDTFPRLWSDVETACEAEDRCVEWQVLDREASARWAQRSISSSPELDAAIATIAAARRHVAASRRPIFDQWLAAEIGRASK